MKYIRCQNMNDQCGNFREGRAYLLYFIGSHGHIICKWKSGVFKRIRSGMLGGTQQGFGKTISHFSNAGTPPTYTKLGCKYLTFELSDDEYLNHIIAEEL